MMMVKAMMIMMIFLFSRCHDNIQPSRSKQLKCKCHQRPYRQQTSNRKRIRTARSPTGSNRGVPERKMHQHGGKRMTILPTTPTEEIRSIHSCCAATQNWIPDVNHVRLYQTFFVYIYMYLCRLISDMIWRLGTMLPRTKTGNIAIGNSTLLNHSGPQPQACNTCNRIAGTHCNEKRSSRIC